MSEPSRDESRLAVLSRLAQVESELRVLRRALADAGDVPSLALDCELQVLRCRIAGDMYGVPIDAVAEIVRYVRVTHVADVPDYVVGAINVRGSLVAVLDTRQRFSAQVPAPKRGTAIVLTRIERRTLGLIVDEVHDVVAIPQHALREPGGALAAAEAVAAIATIEGGVVQVIDLACLLSSRAWRTLDAIDLDSQAPPAPSTRGAGADDDVR